MFCEEPPPKPEKPICRCKNCVLRAADIVPWTNLMAATQTDHEPPPRTRQSVDSVFTIADGEDAQSRNYDKRTSSQSYKGYSPEPRSPVRKGGSSPVQTSHHDNQHPTVPAAPQPTILLIVVNKPEQPSFPGRGYQGPGPGYPGSGPGYLGQAPRGYPGPERRRWPGPGASNGYYYGSPGHGPRPGNGPRPGHGHGPRPGPGPGPGPRRRPGYEDRFRNDGYRDYRNDSRYQEDWRRQSRGYADSPRNRHNPERQRNCRCPEKSIKSGLTTQTSRARQTPEEAVDTMVDTMVDTPSLTDDRSHGSGSNHDSNRLQGSGCPRRYDHCTRDKRPRRSACSCSSIDQETPSNSQNHFPEPLQKVVVTDDKNKTFKCIEVPICITVRNPDCCPCCKCTHVSAPDPNWDSVTTNNAEDEECTCNPQGKCDCDGEHMYPDAFATGCKLNNLERALRNLIPNEDCICYLKKKKRRRRRRKKWAPKVFYDRFANPPIVLNPRPRCLEYGCSPCYNPCYHPCFNPRCCAPVAKSCYRSDYSCGH